MLEVLFLYFLCLNDFINLFVQSDYSSSALPPLIFHISFHFPRSHPPAAILFLSYHSLHVVFFSFYILHSLPFHPLPPLSPPLSSLHISLSGRSPHSLIAHNHSQSVSLTNRPIRVGSRPYGCQADSWSWFPVFASFLPQMLVCLVCVI